MVDERDKIRAARGVLQSTASTGTPFGQAGSAPAGSVAAPKVGSVSEVSGLKITGTERNAAKEAEAKAIGYSAEYIASRGGINAQGYFNDTPLSGQLSAAEYKSVTKPDGTINTSGMARILQEKQIAELVSQGMSKDEATRRISAQYGEFGIGGGTPAAGGITPLTGGTTPTGGAALGGGMVTQADVQKAVTD